MVALLALLVPLVATARYDKNGNPDSLLVQKGHRFYPVKASYGSDTPYELKQRVEFRGGVVQATDKQIVFQRNNKEKQLHSLTAFDYGRGGLAVELKNGTTLALSERSKGGVVVGDHLYWIIADDAVDTMGEPSMIVSLHEFVFKGEDYSFNRVTLLTGLGAHIAPSAVVEDEHIAFVSHEGISLFDSKKFAEIATAKDGEGCVGPTGTIYFEKGGAVSVFSPITGSLTMKGMVDLGYLTDAYRVGNEDVLVLQMGMWTPNTRASYRFPGPGNTGGPQPFFVVPDIGIGFIDKYAFPTDSPGILLSPKYLQPLTMIRRG